MQAIGIKHFVLATFASLFSASLALAQLTVIVTSVPAITPATDDIYIAGDFQGWNPGSAAHRLTKNTAQSTYEITLGSVSGNITFKFTRGAWPKVEGAANGNFIPNRTYNAAPGDTVYLQIQGWEDLNGTGGNSTAAANVSILTDSFYMPQLNSYRRVWLYLPPNYATSNADYPVLYMHDGQNVFDANTSFSGEWEVDETLNALFQNGDPGIIVVAIDNGGSARIDEYSAWSNPTYGGGNGAAYLNFLAQDLKPYIDANYRTLPGRDHTGLMGSSLGGLISTYGGIKHQSVFGKIGALSPSYWFNPEMYGFVANTGKQQNMRIYQLAGTLEGSNMAGNMWRMQDTLLQAGFGVNEILSVEQSDGQHAEWFWKREFAAAYIWLFRSTLTEVPETVSPADKVHLYPNPASESLHVALDVQENLSVQIEIADLQGKVLEAMQYDAAQAGARYLTVDLAALGISNGTYFARISAGTYTTTLKFIVAK